MGLPLRLGLETLGVGAPHLAWGGSHPPPPFPLAVAPLVDGIQGRRPPSQGAYIKGGREGSNITALGASLLPCYTSLSLVEARRSPAGIPLNPPPRRRAAGSPSISPSPLLDQEGGDVSAPYVC